ncbi:hypothetical protein RYH80_10130 [Halobaculum sp. MBLA0147]|uniref:hypothetical protein n=1 Tax=Halobaculum sp. MBLA0147 TaxID=3079934 RepID=UPI0035238731
MPMKGSGTANLREIDRHDAGVGWIAYPDEQMQRASHAVVHDGEVWVLDPVDATGVDDLLAELDGEVAGVVTCLDRHKRDGAAVANRHDVPVYVPEWMTGVAPELDAPVERFGATLTEGVRAVEVRDSSLPPWQEVALLFESSGTLFVPEALGTAEYMVTGSERLGVHPMLRLTPPRSALTGLDPEHVVVGHGEGVHGNAADAVADALAAARGNTLSLYGKTVKSLLS